MKYSMCLSTNPAQFEAVPFKGDFRQNVQKIAEMGFDGIELAIRDPNIIDQDEIYSILEIAGMQVPAIGTGQAWGEEGLSFTDPDSKIREKAIERVLSHIDFAARTGALIIIGLLRGVVKPGVTLIDADQWLHEAFSYCCKKAALQDVCIAFEPINRYETSLLNSVRSGLKFIDEIGGENLGMLLDTFHMNIEEPSIEESIRIAGDRMFHFHYADSNRLYPGCGHIDFRSILKVLHRIDYKGFLSGEHRPDPEPALAAAQGLRYLRVLEEELEEEVVAFR
ncbi:MAG: sugar phosphate isomerase/epimerase [Spirochaetes bacterium]|nr:sugar phosphate isomerase/epimerase [Spirochaetota bacterium]MBL7006229.1 sugar phosphate isomerase/epimerase [Spirochaetia bacterium]